MTRLTPGMVYERAIELLSPAGPTGSASGQSLPLPVIV
jgi:hypothetical protein